MSHQDSFRKGWQSEALAYYVISKFAFLDKPSTIGDDIGIDYHCTLFNKKQVRNKTNLIPTKYKFAIQIKSNKQQEPAVLWKGEIVDGRCRQIACQALGIKRKNGTKTSWALHP